jgi:hypothetical protein
LIVFIKNIVDKISGMFSIRLFNNFCNKTINNYPEVDLEKIKDLLLTSFIDKKSYTREEIAEKINRIL